MQFVCAGTVTVDDKNYTCTGAYSNCQLVGYELYDLYDFLDSNPIGSLIIPSVLLIVFAIIAVAIAMFIIAKMKKPK